MRDLRRALCAVVLACATPSFAATLLQLDHVPDLPSGPIQRVVSSADGAFTVSAFVIPRLVGNTVVPSVEEVNVTVQVTCQRPDCHVGQWSFRFGLFSPTGSPLVPGTYEGAGFSGPLEALYNSASSSCPLEHQRVVIHELDLDPDGRLLHFAADFERQCPGGLGGVAGILRWHAGDAACDGQPDGTPCDDHNPCTPDDACTAGECLAPASSPCSPLTCDDGNPCTDDAVDGAACSHQPIQGSCWNVTYQTKLVVSALGRSCGCRLPSSSGRLALSDDGHFRWPGGEVDKSVCPTGYATIFPDEVGTWHTRGRARVLETSNLADVLTATENCGGDIGIAIRHYGTRVRLSADARRLDGQQVMSGKLRGAPATARIVSRLGGVPGSGAATSPSITLDRVNAAAQRCQRRIVSCFRQ